VSRFYGYISFKQKTHGFSSVKVVCNQFPPHFIVRCEQCNYFLYSTCARLPLNKRHPSHPHLLTLSATARGQIYIDGIEYCRSCGCLSHGFAYTCHGCNYSVDIRCCSIPTTFKHEVHQHSLYQAQTSIKGCNACNWPKTPGIGVFVCTKCEFALGFECATLPLKAKYEYHPHLLSLTHAIAKNYSEEYYCLACEEIRNPNNLFYYCVQAHPRCVVIRRNPYIKYGRNFTLKDHPHPLTFGWKTKDSRPCDACSETFDGHVTLHCTQCKVIIHWRINCIEKIRVKALSFAIGR
jgi:hypothetical protein